LRVGLLAREVNGALDTVGGRFLLRLDCSIECNGLVVY